MGNSLKQDVTRACLDGAGEASNDADDPVLTEKYKTTINEWNVAVKGLRIAK